MWLFRRLCPAHNKLNMVHVNFSQERITVFLCANMTGEKFKPFVNGKSEIFTKNRWCELSNLWTKTQFTSNGLQNRSTTYLFKTILMIIPIVKADIRKNFSIK